MNKKGVTEEKITKEKMREKKDHSKKGREWDSEEEKENNYWI
jgi:hypothetical protein